MADQDAVKIRFAEALKARRSENLARLNDRTEEAQRVLTPILERVDAIRSGLELVGIRNQSINRRPVDANDDGDHWVDIVMNRGDQHRTVTVRVVQVAGGARKIGVVGLTDAAATALGKNTGAHASGDMSVNLNCSGDVADAIEASAVDFFGEG